MIRKTYVMQAVALLLMGGMAAAGWDDSTHGRVGGVVVSTILFAANIALFVAAAELREKMRKKGVK